MIASNSASKRSRTRYVGAGLGVLAGLLVVVAALSAATAALLEHSWASDAISGSASRGLATITLAGLVAALVSVQLTERHNGLALTAVGALISGSALVWLSAAMDAIDSVVLLAVVAAGFAPSVVVARLLVTEVCDAAVLPQTQRWTERDGEGHQRRYVYYSWYWASLCGGVTVALTARSLFDINTATVLGVAGAASLVGSIEMFRCSRAIRGPLVAGQAAAASSGIRAVDVPWARRSTACALALGILCSGLALSGYSLLVDEWQRSQRGAAGVLATAAAAALVAVTIGRWFHRLELLRGAHRAASSGNQLTIGAAMLLLGAVSFTYVGLIASWAFGAAALALAAVTLDASTWSALHPTIRRVVMTRQCLAFVAGAGLGSLLLAYGLDGRHDQLKIAVLSLGCLVTGYVLARHRPSTFDPSDTASRSWSRSVPRRVDPDENEDAPVLRVCDASVAYDGVRVVSGANLEIARGQVVALLGTNGAGKTTTLRAISGLEPLVEGRIEYQGLNITNTPPTWRAGMGLQQIVGGDAVASRLTVADNLRLFAYNLPSGEARSGIAAAFEVFPRLRERGSQRAATLSGGEKQMLALAKAFIVSPRLLLIDEFSLGLAPALVSELVPVVRLIASRGSAVLLVEQSVELARQLADYAYVMEKGEIRSEGATADMSEVSELVRSVYLE